MKGRHCPSESPWPSTALTSWPGFFFEDGAGRFPFSEIEAAIKTFPGDWSATAALAEHPEDSFHYRSDIAQGMASQFKVLILAKVCDEIAHGRMKEDDRMELTAAIRGVPSCTLCNFQAGLKPTVHDVVHLMISTSDNTATDLLREVLGWKSITDYVRANGGVDHPRPWSPPRVSSRWSAPLDP